MRQTFLSIYTNYGHGQFKLTYVYTNFSKVYLKYDSSRAGVHKNDR